MSLFVIAVHHFTESKNIRTYFIAKGSDFDSFIHFQLYLRVYRGRRQLAMVEKREVLIYFDRVCRLPREGSDPAGHFKDVLEKKVKVVCTAVSGCSYNLDMMNY